jgi:hypothetical protein
MFTEDQRKNAHTGWSNGTIGQKQQQYKGLSPTPLAIKNKITEDKVNSYHNMFTAH